MSLGENSLVAAYQGKGQLKSRPSGTSVVTEILFLELMSGHRFAFLYLSVSLLILPSVRLPSVPSVRQFTSFVSPPSVLLYVHPPASLMFVCLSIHRSCLCLRLSLCMSVRFVGSFSGVCATVRNS